MKIIHEFRKFALRGNMIDLAVGFTVGAAFTTVVKSIVSDVIMPPLGLLLGRADFTDLFWILQQGQEIEGPYQTLAQAREAGAVTLNYGLFINNLVAFALVAVAMFLIVRGINRMNDELEERFGQEKSAPTDPTEKKCQYCLSTIPYHAVRCPACTSQLETKAS